MNSELVPTSGGLSSSEFVTPMTCLPMGSILGLEVGASGCSQHPEPLPALALDGGSQDSFQEGHSSKARERRVECGPNGQQFQTHHLAKSP